MGCCYSVKCSKCGCPQNYYTGTLNDPLKGKKRSFRRSCRVHDNEHFCKTCDNIHSNCYHDWVYKFKIPNSC